MATKLVRTRAVVISLEDSHGRRTRFSERAKAADTKVDWQFFDAHRELDSRLAYDTAKAARVHGRSLQPGELGVYSSHVGTWRALLEGDADQFVVLEDDTIVDWRALELIAKHDFSANGYDYVKLFYKRASPHIVLRTDYIINGTSLVQLLGKPYGAQGYVITRAGAQKMLPACQTVVRPIDDQMDRFWEHGIPNLSLFPFPLMEEAGPSDIGPARYEKMRRPQAAFTWKDSIQRNSISLTLQFRAKATKLFRKLAPGASRRPKIYGTTPSEQPQPIPAGGAQR